MLFSEAPGYPGRKAKSGYSALKRRSGITQAGFFLLVILGGAAIIGVVGISIVQAQTNTYSTSSATTNPNGTVEETQNATITNGSGFVNDTSTTGVSVNLTGLSGVTSANVTSETLKGPSKNEPLFGVGGIYFDVSVSIPSNETLPANANATICFTNTGIVTTDTLSYWDKNQWLTASDVTITGDTICGTVPVSALTGTNFVAAQPTTSIYSNVYLWVGVVVAVVIVVGIAFWLRTRGRKGMGAKAPQPATTS